ncbi:MAG TPA: patatin-like phospholipase family protein [Zeimonas sp.]|nr:patatin-like phospholipase family protein [Zeimonas sp.]
MSAPVPHASSSVAPASRSDSAPRHELDLALQGGGAHGAFTWGVLDRLLEDDRIGFAGISGTSAGAMNAVVLAAGWAASGRAGAREALRTFWSEVAATARRATPFDRGLFGAFLGNPLAAWSGLGQYYDLVGRMLSPYQFNPLNYNPLRDIVARVVDFDAVRRSEVPRLFVAATQVSTGRLRIFRNPELSLDALMASACLPTLFHAVEIDGEAYWDGGYTGNPSLFPLIGETPADDLLLVQINPSRRDTVPTDAASILDRIDEITFHGSLIKELRTVAMLQRLVRMEARACRDPSIARIASLRVHRLDGGEHLARFGRLSKADTDWSFLLELHGSGRAQADRWLREHFDDLGRRSTVDLEAEFLLPAGEA